MKMSSITKTLFGLAAGVAAYVYMVRPWHLRWGTSEEESTMPMPGDDVKPDAGISVTHALTIDAPPEAVWQWLVQLGQDRGGFFSYDFIENLFGLDVHNVYDVRPELQDLKVGDFVRSAHEGWLGGRFDDKAGWFVVALEPNRALVLRDEIEHGSWSFVLTPLPERRTRLLIRARGDRPEGILKQILHANTFFSREAKKPRKTKKRGAEMAKANQDDANFSEHAVWAAQSRWQRAPVFPETAIPAEDIERIIVRFEDFAGRWSGLPVGGSITFEWAPKSTKGKRARAR